MVGCCSFGPCKKKRSYEFNNPGYEAGKSSGTYRQSQLLEDEDEEDENRANGDAKQKGEAGDAVDGDPGIKGVVAVELDSDSPSVLGESDSTPGKKGSKGGKDSKKSSKKSSSSKKGSKKDKKGSKSSDKNKNDSDEAAVETGEGDEGEKCEKRKESDDAGSGAVPYSVDGETEQTTTYTTVIEHQIEGQTDSGKRDSNASSHTSSTRVISTFDPTGEGHFHSEHQYTAELSPGRTSPGAGEGEGDDGGRYTNQSHGEEFEGTTTERSSVLVNVRSETEELDNVANSMAEDVRNEGVRNGEGEEEEEEWHTVTEVTETVIHINSPTEIGDTHRYTSY